MIMPNLSFFIPVYKVKHAYYAYRIPTSIYLLQVNNKNARSWYDICSKIKIKTAERRQVSLWCLYC